MDFLELIINLNVLIGLAYFLVAVLVVVAPISVKSFRVLGLWGLLLLVHVVIFFVGCGLHHYELGEHVTATGIILEDHGTHLLITSLMQVYGAIATSAIGIFKGHWMMDKLRTELVKTRRKKDV